MPRLMPLPAAFAALIGCLSAAAGEKAAWPQVLQVEMDKVIQNDYLGVNAVYLGFAFMPEQIRKGMTDADRKREFDRIAAMKLNIARIPYFPEWVQNSDFEGGRNGTRTYATTGTDKVAISAVRQPSGDWSFLVVNCGGATPIKVSLSKPLGKPLCRYLYDPATVQPTEAADLVGCSRTFEKVDSGFEDELPPKAVAIYSTVAEKREAGP